jgi:hypothetical protein
MPTPTYTPLANITLGSAAASVTFSSINQSYRDLVLVSNLQASAANTLYLRFNASTTTYSWVGAIASSGGATSITNASANGALVGASTIGLPTSAIQATSVAQIMDYTATDKHKTVLARYGNSSSEVDMFASRWGNTAAITSVQVIVLPSGNLSTGSTFSLYGIVA